MKVKLRATLYTIYIYFTLSFCLRNILSLPYLAWFWQPFQRESSSISSFPSCCFAQYKAISNRFLPFLHLLYAPKGVQAEYFGNIYFTYFEIHSRTNCLPGSLHSSREFHIELTLSCLSVFVFLNSIEISTIIEKMKHFHFWLTLSLRYFLLYSWVKMKFLFVCVEFFHSFTDFLFQISDCRSLNRPCMKKFAHKTVHSTEFRMWRRCQA